MNPWATILVAAVALALLIRALDRGPLAGLRRRGFARLYDRAMRGYESHMAERRRALVGPMRGTVLEIGPGTGANLPYLDAAVRWIGVEPNPHMRRRLRARAAALGRTAEFRDLDRVRDGEVDVVLSTLTLCSVDDLPGLLGEIRRVLAPGGEFHFLEHVAAPAGSPLRRRQRLARPIWRFVADGCRPDRETERHVREAGFSRVEVEPFEVLPPACHRFISPHLVGRASGSGSNPVAAPGRGAYDTGVTSPE